MMIIIIMISVEPQNATRLKQPGGNT